MSDGTTKLIEQVKTGDLVLSKNEQTGEIVAKEFEWVDNASGHFKPQDSSLVIAADAFAQLPSTMKDTAFKVIPWSAPH